MTDTFKRRKRGMQYHGTTIPNTVEERRELLLDVIKRLKEAKPMEDGAFVQLRALSQDTPVLQPWSKGNVDKAGAVIWNGPGSDGDLLGLLVEALIAFILGQAKEESRVDALVLIKDLLKNQSGLFEQLMTRPPCLTFDLAKALVSCKVDLFSTVRTASLPLLNQLTLPCLQISTAAEDAFNTLLRTFPHQTGLDILMYLLQEEAGQQEYRSTSSLETQLHPLSTLFLHLSQLVPKIPSQLLEEFLDHGAANVLLKVCVRSLPWLLKVAHPSTNPGLRSS